VAFNACAGIAGGAHGRENASAEVGKHGDWHRKKRAIGFSA
jgi:hypothetical protein